MSFTIKVANFPGRNAGESVAWVTVDTGTCAGVSNATRNQPISQGGWCVCDWLMAGCGAAD